MSFFIFIVVFMSLFGPKVAEVIDLSVLGGVFGLVFLFFIKKVFVSREYVVVVMFVAVVALHSILVVFFNGMDDLQPILRHFRALISTVLLGLIFYNLAINSVLSSATLINVLIAVLLVNASVIMLSIIFPDIKINLTELYGFDKKFVDLRSFGLTAGYDTAGYLCIIGATLSAACAYYKGAVRYSFIFLVFISAVFFTSRSSMVLAGVLIVGVCTVFILKGRWTLKVISAGYIVAGVSVAIYYVVPLIISTFILQTSDITYTSNFAATDLSGWYETMWILPEHPVSVLLGTGEVVKTSDLGYVSLIFMIGVVGLLLVALIYVYMFFVVKALNRAVKRGYLQMDDGGRILAFSLMTIIFFMFVINFKNLYFLTRSYHELIVILFFFIMGLSRKGVLERSYTAENKIQQHRLAVGML